MRPYWWLGLVDSEEYQIWEDLSEDLRNKAHMMGGKVFFDWLEESCSHVIQISSVQPIRVKQIETALVDIYTDQLQTLHADPPTEIACSNVLARYNQFNARLNSLRLFNKSRAWSRVPIVQSAFAATVLVLTVLTAVHMHMRKPSATGNYSQVLSTALRLPPASHHRYETVLLNLYSSSGTYSRRLKRKKIHQRPSIVHTFVLTPKTAPAPSTQIAALEAPPCCDGREVNDSLPIFLQSEPELPEIRPRRSRFVRIMARVSTPFRYIGSRQRESPE
jgi:hypothetical protein